MPRLLDEFSDATPPPEVVIDQLDVTKTRAKRVLGGGRSRNEWQLAGIFSVAAETLHTRSAPPWLWDQMAPAR